MLSKNIQVLRKKHGYTQPMLAEMVGVSVQSIGAWENGIYSPKGERLARLAEVLGITVEELTSSNLSATRVPVLGQVPAGIPIEAITEIVDWEDIPSQYDATEYFGLKVRGDSMFPKYIDGDTVIVRAQNYCDNGQDCIVQVNGFDATLKSVYIHKDAIELRSYNDKYEPMLFSSVRVLGVVVELRRKV